jgi:type IV secretion system protein VirB6
MYQVFQQLDTYFTEPLNIFVTEALSNVSSWAAGPIAAAVTLYIVVFGYLIVRGSIGDPMIEFVFRAIKAAIVLALVQNVDQYQFYVGNLFLEALPRELSSAINAGTAPSASAFDSLLDKGQEAANAVWERAAWPVDVASSIGGAIIIVITFVVAAIGYVVSLYARLALAVIVALGPIFIACALFSATRRFTEAWIGQMVNFVLLQVLVMAIGALLIGSLEATFAATEAYTDVLMRPIALGAIGLASLYVFYQLPSIASSLAAGGAALTYGYAAGRDAHQGLVVTALSRVPRPWPKSASFTGTGRSAPS